MKTNKLKVIILAALMLTSSLLIFPQIPTANADNLTDAITLGLDWIDRMVYMEINSTHAVARDSPCLSFRMERSDGNWTIFGKETPPQGGQTLNLPDTATNIEGGCLSPTQTTTDLNLITGEINNQRMEYKWDIDSDGEYDDVTLYVEYATMDADTTKVAGKITNYQSTGVSLDLWLEETEVMTTVSNGETFGPIIRDWGWAGSRYTIRPTTKGLADLYCWLATSQFSWLGGATYADVQGINYTDRALKLYRTWYGAGYIFDRFDGHYGVTMQVRPWAGEYGIPDYDVNPDLILEPYYADPGEDSSTYYSGDDPTDGWYNYSNAPEMNRMFEDNCLRHTVVSRHIMPDEEWNNLPLVCNNDYFAYPYMSRTGFAHARNAYIANGFEYDLINYQNVPDWLILPGPEADVCLGIGTDAKSIRACHDMYKYGSNIPYGNGLSTLKEQFIDTATWDGNGIAFDSWRGTSLGWPYPAYGTHNTATYGNALVQYYKLTNDSDIGARADQVIGVLLMLQNKLNTPVFSRSRGESYYRPEFIGSFLPGYAVAYSFGQQDIYSADWVEIIYSNLWIFGENFQEDPYPVAFPVMGNAECTIPSIWTLIQYKTTGRTPVSPPEADYSLPFIDGAVAYTDHGGSYGGDGDVEIVSGNLTSTYIGGDTGNVYKHVGDLNRIRMAANSGGSGGDGWSKITYEWGFYNPSTTYGLNAKVYFTIPSYAGETDYFGTNSLQMDVELIKDGYTWTSTNKVVMENVDEPFGSDTGKMFIYDDLIWKNSLSSGNWTIRLSFTVRAEGVGDNGLHPGYKYYYMGYPNNPREGLPMGLEYFGLDFTWQDNFDDNNRDQTKWDVLLNDAGVQEETQRLKLTVWEGHDLETYVQSGYVTKSTINFQYNYTVSIDLAEFDTLGELTLQICNTKTTNSDPDAQSNWYRILHRRYGYQDVLVQKKVNGAKSWVYNETYTNPTGTLKITVYGGHIYFYNDNELVYSESYSLPSYSCYVYIFQSTDNGSPYWQYWGSDYMDNFRFAKAFNP
jgi:hypothetical protein